MKNIFLVLALCILSETAFGQDSYIITDVNLIPMTRDVVIPHQAVTVEHGVITRIEKSKSKKKNNKFTVIDGTGKYLMPGLFDMHVHFFHEQGDYKNTCEIELKMMLANGLTFARIMAGHPAYLDAKKKVNNGEWIGPHLTVVSPQFVGRWPWPDDFKNFEIVDSKAKAAEAVKKYKQQGYDAIKLTFMITRDAYDGAIEAAKKENIPVTGHVGPQVKLPTALAAGQQIEHLDEFIDMLLPDTSYNHGQSISDMNIWRPRAWATVPFLDESKIPSLVQQVKQSGIFVSPTNYFIISSFGIHSTDEEYIHKSDYAYIPKNIKEERWSIRQRYWSKPPSEESRAKVVRLRKKITYELWKAGVPLMAGSDSPEWFLVQGFSIHDELRTFVDCGLSPFGALQTATVNTARYLDIAKTKGTIEIGKDADLILLNKNPLDDINNTREIEAVFLGKKWFDKKKIQSFLQEARTLAD